MLLFILPGAFCGTEAKITKRSEWEWDGQITRQAIGRSGFGFSIIEKTTLMSSECSTLFWM